MYWRYRIVVDKYTMSSDSCKDGASKTNDGVCDKVNDMLHNMSTTDGKEVIVSVCANCGKDNATNTCNKCNSVKYCNAACKKKHRAKHKKQCERRVAELHDEKLFKQPPPVSEDCPICFLRMPLLGSGQLYMACCGKVICCGCIHAADARDKNSASLCPFCRTPPPTTEREAIKRYKKRTELNDTIAMSCLGDYYATGDCGLSQSHAKALELYHQAAELGNPRAYYDIGNAYRNGRGVEMNMKKAMHYWELAAMRGIEDARHNLGVMEEEAGNMDRALKHWMISVGEGDNYSLECIKRLYMETNASKDDYTKALRLYQAHLNEIKSVQRDEAAAFNADWRYY